MNYIPAMNSVFLGSALYRVILVVAFVVANSWQCAGQDTKEKKEADLSNLEEVSKAWVKNQFLLQTWEGKAKGEWVRKKGDSTRESEREIEFAFDRHQDKMIHTMMQRVFAENVEPRVLNEGVSGFGGFLRTADSTTEVFISLDARAKGRKMPPSIHPRLIDKTPWNDNQFDPILHMQLVSIPVDADIHNDILSYNLLNGVGFTIVRDNDIVRFTWDTKDGIVYQKHYDLSTGGNPCLYHYHRDSGRSFPFATDIDITAEYHQINGVWIPSFTKYSSTGDQFRDGEMRFYDDRVNEELADDRFSLKRLEVDPGDAIWDTRLQAGYTFQPDEVKPVLEQVNAATEPGDSNPPPTTPVVPPAELIRPVPFWKNWGIVSMAGILLFGFVLLLVRRQRKKPSDSNVDGKQS